MKSFAYLLPVMLGVAVAQEVADARHAFNAALDAVLQSQSESLGPVISAVLDSTGGDERAYYRLMQEAADAGHPVALSWLGGQIRRQGASQADAAARIKAAVEQAADKGYVPALIQMADLAYAASGGAADEKQGLHYLMKACKAGSPRARALYLLLTNRLEKEGASSPAVQAELQKKNFYVEEYLAAISATRDEAASKEWMHAAAAHGSPGAACSLGLYYLRTEGQEKRGLELLQKAAELYHPEAMCYLASMLVPDAELPDALADLVAPDAGRAVRLFQRAALSGYVPALLPLAGEYRKQPAAYSAERVFALYRLAADAGDPRGGVAYAYCLASGRGCTAEPERGAAILNRLVDAGVPFANMALADLYFNGTGVPADMTRAVAALTAAAAEGVPQCYTLMAALAQIGNASKAPDPARARLYLRLAQERGEVDSQQAFDILVNTGTWKFIP